MAARIVCVCNQKGGCGKTTITMMLAAGASRRGYHTLVVDGDQQGSAVAWSANAPDDNPFPAVVVNLSAAGRRLPQEVKKLVDNFNLIFIDCPPSVESPIAQASLMITDLAIIPLIPSGVDVAAVTPFLELTQQASLINERLLARVVPNMVQRTQVSDAYLTQLTELPVPASTTRLMKRTAHEKAATFGTSVHNISDGNKATDEVEQLLDEVLQLLSLPPQRPATTK